jgi:hypothetical protein
MPVHLAVSNRYVLIQAMGAFSNDEEPRERLDLRGRFAFRNHAANVISHRPYAIDDLLLLLRRNAEFLRRQSPKSQKLDPFNRPAP